MALLNKEIIIPLHQHLLTMYDSRLNYLLQKLIVKFGSFINQSQLGQIAMLHAIIKHSLHQEDNHKPVDGDESE